MLKLKMMTMSYLSELLLINQMGSEFTSLCGLCCALSSFILFIMLISSFSSLDYNDVGLDYSSITKTIYPKIYTAGFHFLGIGHSFIHFSKTV